MLTAEKKSLSNLSVFGKRSIKNPIVTYYGLNYPQQKLRVSKLTSKKLATFFSLWSVLLEYGNVFQLNSLSIQCSNKQEGVFFFFISMLADKRLVLYINFLHYVGFSFRV